MNSELELDDSDFLGSRKCRAEVRTSGLQPMPANGVRGSDLAIFPGTWAQSSRVKRRHWPQFCDASPGTSALGWNDLRRSIFSAQEMDEVRVGARSQAA